MAEARETVEIVNTRGLHARASAKFVNAVAMLPETLDITVLKDGSDAGNYLIPFDTVMVL